MGFYFKTLIGLICLIFTIGNHACGQSQKVQGVCLVGPFEATKDHDPISSVQQMGANWITLTPEAFIERSTLRIIPIEYDLKWTNSLEGYISIIKEAKEKQLKIFFKPHLILKAPTDGVSKLKSSASWRGDIAPKNPTDWNTIEKNYTEYILSLARMAELYQVEAFCIGTELKSFIKNRPIFWNGLIQKVRNVFSGTISYSANWDNYENIPFWSDLDIIGVNSYFPIEKSKIPSLQKAIKNWNTIISKLNDFRKRYNKLVVITEFGYRNVAFAGLKPWTHDKGQNAVVDASQINLLSAFFESIWNQEWIVGGFLWNWNYKEIPIPNTDFTIQNKPALAVIKKHYLNASNP